MGELRSRLLIRFINAYPPYLGAGIRVLSGRCDDFTYVVRMKLRWFNRNLFGTHFGGSLYSMADPFFVFLLMRHLGKGYLVWDKAAAIDFLRPGRGTVTGTYRVTPEAIAEVREKADRGEKVEPVFTADLVANDGEVVARVTKRLWVKKKA
jgi:acyl-coenzyme A thioesterase PaaI-like protein